MTYPWPTYIDLDNNTNAKLNSSATSVQCIMLSGVQPKECNAKTSGGRVPSFKISHFHMLLGLGEDAKYSLAHSCWYNPPLVAVVLDLD
jgi:hypothetical protein